MENLNIPEVVERVNLSTTSLKEAIDFWWSFSDLVDDYPDWVIESLIKLELQGWLFDLEDGTWQRFWLN